MKTIEEEVGERLRGKGLTLSTAESCTSGGVAARITSVPGSSDYFKGGIVAYANEVKEEVLGVSEKTLAQHGAVSRETVLEMANGAKRVLKTDCAVATSGIAGPGGGSRDKPVGTIWMAAICGDTVVVRKQEGDCGREKNVQKAIENVLSMLLDILK